MNKLFLRRPVFVKRFTHEMTLQEVPGSEARFMVDTPVHTPGLADRSRKVRRGIRAEAGRSGTPAADG